MQPRGRIYTPAPIAPHPVNDGMAAWYLGLPELAGGPTFYDITGRYPLALTGAPPWIAHPNGFAGLQLDGSTQYGQVSANPTTRTAGWTMSAWVRPSSINQFGMIAYNSNDSNGYGFGMNNGTGAATGAVLVGLFGGVAWVNSGYSFPAINDWYFVEVGRDVGGTSRFWVNGIQTASTSASVPLAPTTARFTVGCELTAANAASRFFVGSIAGARVLDRYCGGILYEESASGHLDALRRIAPRAWSFGAAAPATFNPAWANRATTIVGAGF